MISIKTLEHQHYKGSSIEELVREPSLPSLRAKSLCKILCFFSIIVYNGRAFYIKPCQSETLTSLRKTLCIRFLFQPLWFPLKYFRKSSDGSSTKPKGCSSKIFLSRVCRFKGKEWSLLRDYTVIYVFTKRTEYSFSFIISSILRSHRIFSYFYQFRSFSSEKSLSLQSFYIACPHHQLHQSPSPAK